MLILPRAAEVKPMRAGQNWTRTSQLALMRGGQRMWPGCGRGWRGDRAVSDGSGAVSQGESEVRRGTEWSVRVGLRVGEPHRQHSG